MFQILVRATFVLLLLATVAAFFVAQRLKKTTPLVNNVRVTKYFSPNGDSFKDRARLSFLTKKGDNVTASIVDENDGEVRRLATDRYLSKGRHVFHWDGRTDDGRRVADGEYHLRVGLRDEGRTATTPKKIFVDTKPPRPVVTSVSPGWISPGAESGSVAKIRYQGSTRSSPEFLVYRTGVKRARLVTKFRGNARSSVAEWDGTIDGRAAPRGNYLVAVRVRDAAGNLGSGPASLPPTRKNTNGHPGVVVSYIASLAPLKPVLGGSVARIRVLTRLNRYRWSLRRSGAKRPSKRGRGRGGLLRFRVPKRRPGVYLLRLWGPKHSFTTPIVVREEKRRPILVVLSVTTWQAFNPLDSNDDGWADVLGVDKEVPLKRPFARGLPEGFTDVVSPLLNWLDDEGLKYRITTDYALSRGKENQLEQNSAVVFAGSQVFPTERLTRAIRRYVKQGGKIASMGSGAFLRTASLTSRKLFDPTYKVSEDIFGERLVERSQPPGPIAALDDRIGLFNGTGGTFGRFSQLEEAKKLSKESQIVAAAGQNKQKPAMVMFSYGKGEVVRSGSYQWNGNLRTSSQIQLIMRRMWKRLSR